MEDLKNYLTPVLPLRESDELDYEHLSNYEDLVKQNLKNIVLTSPGERVMDPSFGVGIMGFLFEQNTPSLRGSIEGKIREQVSKYMPFVNLTAININTSEDETKLSLSINYSVPALSSTDIMILLFEDGALLKS